MGIAWCGGGSPAASTQIAVSARETLVKKQPILRQHHVENIIESICVCKISNHMAAIRPWEKSPLHGHNVCNISMSNLVSFQPG
mmetsp:Transcript_14564/g.24916  ORF Transcript_14564/g.24916 Transcript_14564/m.24916 type:complete len:84 (+) Transcript_14564:11-262(+)